MSAWYERRGLRFACTRCNDCCRRAGDVFFDDAEADRIAERLCGVADAERLAPTLWSRDYDGRWRIEVPEGGACTLLGADGCTVHDIKPLQCATYPFWPELLEHRYVWKAESRYCEGIGRGETPYSAAAIERMQREQSTTRENG